MAGIYSFIRAIPGKLGVGVADAGFERSSTIPVQSIYRPETAVRRCLAATRPSYAILDQNVPIVSPLGLTGLMVHGTTPMQQLAKKG